MTGAANGTALQWRTRPPLRVDLRGLLPEALAALDAAAIERLTVGHGAERLALGELFSVERFAADLPTLRLAGDFGRADRIGWGLAGGGVEVEGDAGDHAGALMNGGTLRIAGSSGLLAGCQMAGGRLEVGGDVGDHAGSGLPGSLDGMRGGTFVVRGNAGARAGDRMRRGTLLVLGGAGPFAASRMVAGTLVVAGRCGVHPAWGQRRGSVLLLGGSDAAGAPLLPTTFVPAGADAPVAWQLLARSLEPLAPALAGLPRRRMQRWLGDLAVDGRGELLLPAD